MTADREAFERVMLGYDLTKTADGQDYALGHARAAWKAWQAARQLRASESFVVVPREPTPEIIQAMNDRMYEGANYIDANSIEFNLLSEVYRAAIAASAGE